MRLPAGLVSSAWDVPNSRKAADTQGTRPGHCNKTYASGGKGGGGNKKSVDAATALGLGAQPQKTMLSGMAGLGMVQQNPLDSLFGSVGTNALTGLSGLGGASLQSANIGNDLLQLAALQRTGVDKIPAIRFWGGVGGANIKNPATPLAPQAQTRRTTVWEYCCTA